MTNHKLGKNFVFLAISLGINSFASLMFETVIIKQLSFIIGVSIILVFWLTTIIYKGDKAE